MPRRVIRHAVIQPADTSIRLIALTRGQNAIVDAIDYEWLQQWNWFAHRHSDTKKFYAYRNSFSYPGKPILMHREILQLGEDCGTLVDHKSGITLDNRRDNLRKATPQENSRNVKRRTDNSSGFKGVDRLGSGKWRVRYSVKGTYINCGVFSNKLDAAQVYILATYLEFGEFSSIG